MTNIAVFTAVITIILIVAGKYAGKTLINAIRIGTLILALISLITNWDTTMSALEAFLNKTVPFITKSISQLLTWILSNSIELSDKALKKFIQ